MRQLDDALAKIFPFCERPSYRYSYQDASAQPPFLEVTVIAPKKSFDDWLATLGYNNLVELVRPGAMDATKVRLLSEIGHIYEGGYFPFQGVHVTFDSNGMMNACFNVAFFDVNMTLELLDKVGDAVQRCMLNDAVDEAILNVRKLAAVSKVASNE